MTNYKHSLFIFRRDLRLQDNTALHEALAQSASVSCCFIFDPRQVEASNEYRSNNAIIFMQESLAELADAIAAHKGTLNFFYGVAQTVVEEILNNNPTLDALFINKDYTPFSLKRDAALQQLADKHDRTFHAYDDVMLQEPNTIKNGQNKFYRMFTPFYKKALEVEVAPVVKLARHNFSGLKLKGSEHLEALIKQMAIIPDALEPATRGGSKQAHTILQSIATFDNYTKLHNIPEHMTTLLSAHLKFGTLSVRECYTAFNQKLKNPQPLVRALYWRDFFTYIAYHNPGVFKGPFKEKYNHISWINNTDYFKAWCNGTTGFPIIDAGMAQLNQTGFMHNRVRLIVASFLVKDLMIDWRWGERYFAQKLIEYDPAVNNGNWQWCASTGCDSTPYFRIFNPWRQQEKFDPQCVYIKRWIPQLALYPNKKIHEWYKPIYDKEKTYPRPLVDHHEVSGQVKKYLKSFNAKD